MVLGRLSNGWALLQCFGRCWQDLNFVCVHGLRPETGDPLNATVDFDPFTRSPCATIWLLAPNAADPNEVAAVLVPGPIAGDPNGGRIRINFGRKFFDRLGRSFWYDGARRNIQLEGLGEGLVDWATQQGFDSFRHVIGCDVSCT